MGGIQRVEVLRVEVLQSRRGWRVDVEVEGAVRRYRYGSEAQARYFAAVFALGPRVLPPVRRVARRRKAA
jgi:hypothetical protein